MHIRSIFSAEKVLIVGTRNEYTQSMFKIKIRKLCIIPITLVLLFEPRRKKTDFCIYENKDVDQRLCFRYTEQSLYFLNPKFQASSHLLKLRSLVCVGHGRKPRRPVFSQRGSFKSGVRWGVGYTSVLS